MTNISLRLHGRYLSFGILSHAAAPLRKPRGGFTLTSRFLHYGNSGFRSARGCGSPVETSARKCRSTDRAGRRDAVERSETEGIKKQIEHRVQSFFGVFRLLFGRGTLVHLSSQNAKFNSISQQSTSVSKFIIRLFRHAEKNRLDINQDGFCNLLVRIAVWILALPSPRVLAHFFNSSFSLPIKLCKSL